MKKIICFLLLTLASIATAGATTIWGITGDNVNNGGTLAAKSFDLRAKDNVQLKFVTPKTTGYRYLAETLNGQETAGSVVSGINEKGLVALSITGSTKAGFNEWALNNYGSVDDLLIDKGQASGYAAGTYLVADSGKMAQIKISSGGRIEVREIGSGLTSFSTSSAANRRIRELLDAHPGMFGLDDFIVFSEEPNGGQKQAALVANLPDSGAPQVYIKIANPGEDTRRGQLTLDPDFWSNQTAGDVTFGTNND